MGPWRRARGEPPAAVTATARGRGARWPVVLVALLAATGALAGEWSVEPRIRLSETWSDNAELAAEDPEEESVTEVAPGIRVTGEGRRAQLQLAYRLQQLVHAREPERDRTNHEFNGDGQIELWRNRLFLEGGATRSQDTGGPLLGAPGANTIAPDERNTVTTWSIGPRLRLRFGRFAAFEGQARRQQVDLDTEEGGDTDSDLVTLALTSGPWFPDWGWALDYSRREERRSDTGGVGPDTRLERVRGEVNLRAGAATQVFAAAGTEDNEFVTAEAGDPIDGDFWEAGVRWNPRRTVTLELAAGERFFGETARASLGLRGSALSIELDVVEDLITTPQLQLERSTALLQDAEGNPVLGPDGQPVTVVIDIPTVRDDVLLQRRADARVRYDRGSTTAALALLATERDFQREGESEQARQADLDFTSTRFAGTTLNAGVGFAEQEFAASVREDETTTVRLRAARRLGAGADLSLELENLSRRSTVPGAEFDSLRATIALEATF